MSNKSAFKEPEMIMAICAIFLSVIAVAVALFEVNIARQAQKSSVWPYVDVSSSNHNGMTYLVKNKGLGPAKVQDVKVTFKNKPIKKWRDMFLKINGNFSWSSTTSTINNKVLSPGETLKVLIIDKDNFREFLKTSERRDINVEICYCSVYQDCWITTKHQNISVDSCLPNKELSFDD